MYLIFCTFELNQAAGPIAGNGLGEVGQSTDSDGQPKFGKCPNWD